MKGELIFLILLLVFSEALTYFVGKFVADEAQQARDAITECESTLPRNQTCKYVITAAPEVAE